MYELYGTAALARVVKGLIRGAFRATYATMIWLLRPGGERLSRRIRGVCGIVHDVDCRRCSGGIRTIRVTRHSRDRESKRAGEEKGVSPTRGLFYRTEGRQELKERGMLSGLYSGEGRRGEADGCCGGVVSGCGVGSATDRQRNS